MGFASPTAAYLPNEGSALAEAVELFESIGREIHPDAGDCGWTCDGGAVVAAYICERLGIGYDLRVGLYWWDERDLETVQQMLGRSEDDDWLDEHHHWVEVYADERLIWDPNGEIRGEPRLQLWKGTMAYEVKDDPAEFLVYDPAESFAELASYHTEAARGMALVDERLRPTLGPVSESVWNDRSDPEPDDLEADEASLEP